MKNPREALPLTPLTYHVILALADGDRYGYAVIKEGRWCRLGTGDRFSVPRAGIRPLGRHCQFEAVPARLQ